jgi:hypothetical protein
MAQQQSMEADQDEIRAVADDGHDLPQPSCFPFGKQRRHQPSTDTSAGHCQVEAF